MFFLIFFIVNSNNNNKNILNRLTQRVTREEKIHSDIDNKNNKIILLILNILKNKIKLKIKKIIK